MRRKVMSFGISKVPGTLIEYGEGWLRKLVSSYPRLAWNNWPSCPPIMEGFFLSELISVERSVGLGR